MTTLSRISMAAAAALLVGLSPAMAADLGGNCCADLEERIAELEATTVRKGNRKVSLTISGQISTQIMFWDDGVQNDMYVGGPTQSNSRWRFNGSARISPEITAGFLYEFEAFGSQTASQNQTNGLGPGNAMAANSAGDDAGAGDNVREAKAWVEHSRLGRVTLGHGTSEAANVITVDLSGKGMGGSNDVRLHQSGMLIGFSNGTHHSARTWGNFFQGGQDWLNERVEHIAYRTPTVAGFTLGASFGEDNYWDVALRYAGEFNGIRIAGAIGYSVRSEYDRDVEEAWSVVNGVRTQNFAANPGTLFCDINCDKKVKQLAGSLSIRHMPTGLFFTGAAGKRDYENHQYFTASSGAVSAPNDFDTSFFYLSGGIAKNFFGIGDTVLFGEYSEWKDMGFEYAVDGDSKLTHWGIGVVQHVDAAAMEFWLTYKNFALDADFLCYDATTTRGGCEDLHIIQAGTRIRF